MNSDQIQPERACIPRSKQSLSGISGRAWVKRDLEFWHRCTVERYSNASVTVSLDDLDELTVEPERVAQFELEPGDLVFFRPPFWQGSLSGYPGFVNAVNRETVELDFPSAIYGRQGMRITSLLREIRVYCELPPIEWKNGSQVFAWKAVPFDYIYKSVELKPERFLLFPGRVQGTHYDVCVEIELGVTGIPRRCFVNLWGRGQNRE